MKKIRIMILVLLTLFAMSFLAISASATPVEVYKKVSYQVGVEETAGEPFVVYYGTGTVIISHEDGLELTLIVNGHYPLTDGSRAIKLEPQYWRILPDGSIAAGKQGCWFYYTSTKVTWFGHGKPLIQEDRWMGFHITFGENPCISIWTLPANYPHYQC